jgi:DNA-binding LytR/AlgR family response regulator
MKKLKHLDTISHEKVLYLEANSNYTVLHLEKDRKLISFFMLKIHHEQFPHFIRLSRKFVINPKFVRKIDLKTNKVVTRSGVRFLMSKRRVESVVKSLENL